MTKTVVNFAYCIYLESEETYSKWWSTVCTMHDKEVSPLTLIWWSGHKFILAVPELIISLEDNEDYVEVDLDYIENYLMIKPDIQQAITYAKDFTKNKLGISNPQFRWRLVPAN